MKSTTLPRTPGYCLPRSLSFDCGGLTDDLRFMMPRDLFLASRRRRLHCSESFPLGLLTAAFGRLLAGSRILYGLSGREDIVVVRLRPWENHGARGKSLLPAFPLPAAEFQIEFVG